MLYDKELTLHHTILTVNNPEMPFENIMGKGENPGNQHFSRFTKVFSIFTTKNFKFSVTFILWSVNLFQVGLVENFVKE